MTVPVIALNTNATQYAKLVSLGNSVITGLTGNGNFTTPAVPIATLTTAVDEVTAAIAKWGPVNNRGSHADLMDLKQKALTLHGLLKAEANYVETTAALAAGNDYAAMAAIIATSGFEVKASKHHQGMLQAVQGLRFMADATLNRNQVKLAWEQPLGVTSHNNVKSYNVYRSATTNFADAVHLDTVSKSEYIDANNTGTTVTWSYFVAAIGSAGLGVISGPITVSLVS